MYTMPNPLECDKIARETGGYPEDPISGSKMIDWIMWDSATGKLSYHSMTPENWLEFHSSSVHHILTVGTNQVTGQDIYNACHSYATTYLAVTPNA